MQKMNMKICCAMAAFLCIMVFGWCLNGSLLFAAEGEPRADAGSFDEQEGRFISMDFLEDERMVQVKQQYSAAIDQKSSEAEAESDPADYERIQKEIHELKLQAELEAKEVMLEIAMEKEDEEMIAQLQSDLDLLYNPHEAQAIDDGAEQPPVETGYTGGPRTKTPDDE